MLFEAIAKDVARKLEGYLWKPGASIGDVYDVEADEIRAIGEAEKGPGYIDCVDVAYADRQYIDVWAHYVLEAHENLVGYGHLLTLELEDGRLKGLTLAGELLGT